MMLFTKLLRINRAYLMAGPLTLFAIVVPGVYRFRKKTEEEEEEEFVSFECYRDLIKHPRKGYNTWLSLHQRHEYTQHSDADEEDGEDDDEEEGFNSDDSNDEVMESIAKDFGVKRYGWLLYMDKKAKEETQRQKEMIKGDPSTRKLRKRNFSSYWNHGSSS